MSNRRRIASFRAETLGKGLVALAFLVVGCLILGITFFEVRTYAVNTAKAKAEILLHYNMAIHAYFTEALQPAVLEISGDARSQGYFDPVWMSSEYAIREIDTRFRAFDDVEGVYYKEAAVNARNPQNEADALERSFLEQIKRDATIQGFSKTEIIDGQPFFITMVRGEKVEAACLGCHGDPVDAPAGLVQKYGAARSFHHAEGDVISVVSVRVPLAAEFNNMWGLLAQQALLLFLSLLGLFIIAGWVQKHLLFKPIELLRQKAVQISRDDRALGQQVPLPVGRELSELTNAFNEMSITLRSNEDRLERTIESHTAELHRSQYMLNSILGTIPHFVGVVDHQTGKFQYVNREFKRYLGETIDVILSKSILDYQDILHPEDMEIFIDFMQKTSAAKDGEVITSQFRVKRKSGKFSWLEFHAVVFQRSPDEQPQQVLFTSQDISVQKEAEAKLTFLGLHDALTGLSNRAQFQHFMDNLVEKEHYPVTVIMADIDNLKYVNDTYGHEAGDALLCRIADAIKASLRSSDIVARLGGDEFAALLVNTDEKAARNIQARIQKRMALIISEDELSRAGLSMGMVTVRHGAAIRDGIRQADEIMYIEKARKKEHSPQAEPMRETR